MPNFLTRILMLILIIQQALLITSCNGTGKTPANDSSATMSSSQRDTTKIKPESNVFIHINQIAKKSKEIVDAYLGDPVGHQSISPSNAPCPCESYIYKAGNIEVVFMKDIADWITVNHMDDIPFTKDKIIQALGIKYVEPTIINDRVIKWNDFDGFDQLSVFSNEKGGVSYAFLKATTH
ncbi:MAG: hypothetical protein ABJC12_00180 [Saprospiraceae bacterium]